jgi:hypothetical protein
VLWLQGEDDGCEWRGKSYRGVLVEAWVRVVREKEK